MTKRWSVLLIICLLGSLLLVGCGSSGKPSTQPSPQPSTGTPSNTPPASTPSKPAADMQEALDVLLNKAKTVDGLYFEYVVETTGVKAGNMKMWWTKKAQKMEISQDGQAMTMLLDSEAGIAYMIQPEQKIAMKIPIDKNTTDVEPPVDFLTKISPDVYKVVESTTLNGVKCKVVVPKDASLASGLKLWISEEYGIPIRVEALSDTDKFAIEYRNLKVGPLPPETFKLPSGYQVMDLANPPR